MGYPDPYHTPTCDQLWSPPYFWLPASFVCGNWQKIAPLYLSPAAHQMKINTVQWFSVTAAIQKPPPDNDWKRPVGKPSHTWLRATEANLKPRRRQCFSNFLVKYILQDLLLHFPLLCSIVANVMCNFSYVFVHWFTISYSHTGQFDGLKWILHRMTLPKTIII